MHVPTLYGDREREIENIVPIVYIEGREIALQLGDSGMREMHVPRLYGDRKIILSPQCMWKGGRLQSSLVTAVGERSMS